MIIIFGPIFFGPKIFFNREYLGYKFVGLEPDTVLDPTVFWTEYFFGHKVFWTLNFLNFWIYWFVRPNICWTPKYVLKNVFKPYFLLQNFEFSLTQNLNFEFFDSQFILESTFLINIFFRIEKITNLTLTPLPSP